MFYALSDAATGDHPNEVTHGFANTKEPLAFKTRADRDAWLVSTKLMTAKPITRAQALRLSTISDGTTPGTEAGDWVVRLYGAFLKYHAVQRARRF